MDLNISIGSLQSKCILQLLGPAFLNTTNSKSQFGNSGTGILFLTVHVPITFLVNPEINY